jgi:hypothetical protein
MSLNQATIYEEAFAFKAMMKRLRTSEIKDLQVPM